VVAGLRVRGTLPLPWLSLLPELNVRAYVDYGAPLASISSASTPPGWRQWLPPDGRTRLPCFHAEMSARHQGGTVHYKSERVDSSGPFGPAPGALRR
jgi:uncharacterized protein YqjF (DUF2071 family)